MAHSEEWWLCRHFHSITCGILDNFMWMETCFGCVVFVRANMGTDHHTGLKNYLYSTTYVEILKKEEPPFSLNISSFICMVELQYYNLTFQSIEQSAQSQELFPFRR